jgi:uncharacterized Fe-S cluster protein YjdI
VDYHKNYSNDDITVHWKSELCIHSGNCVRALSAVFNPKRRPWIEINAANTEAIIKAVEGCPSGALSFSRIDDSKTNE